jgi:uncharacterized membrane protein YeaQ/YmgE (transglycosylase-associated protein family)
MSLLIILLIGANIGWLASIILLVDRPRDVFANVGIGVLGAFLFGVMASSVSLLEGITPLTLVVSAAGALVLVAAVNLFSHRDSLGRLIQP